MGWDGLEVCIIFFPFTESVKNLLAFVHGV